MIEQIAVGGFDKNLSYIVHDGTSAAVVDPSGDIENVLSVIREKNLTLVSVLVTHTHFDHIEKLDAFLQTYPVPVYAHRDARERIKGTDIEPLEEGSTVSVGNVILSVLHTPGHIDDAVCFLLGAEHAHDGIPKLITGDTLFVEGCGRVQSEHDAEVIYESLMRLKELPDETEVFPGHDYGSKPRSTIGWEKEHNRFFLAPDLEAFKKERLG